MQALKQHYDYTIAGAGASGLSLACDIVQHPALCDKALLLLDPVSKNTNDRTWCFWTNEATTVDHLITHTWKKLRLQNHEEVITRELENYHYAYVRGLDFYNHTQEMLRKNPNVQMLQARVEHYAEDQNGNGAVTAQGRVFSTNWLFDSTPTKSQSHASQKANNFSLLQHFKGWEITTEKDCFNPEVATFMDFRTEQQGQVRFFYILPFSPTKAMIEFTVISQQLLPTHEYDVILREYIEKQLNIASYTILHQEHGVIPLNTKRHPRQLAERVMSIGGKAGMIRPSTGFCFSNILKDSAAIAESLALTGQPFHKEEMPSRYRRYDALLFDILLNQHYPLSSVFMQLFRNNRIENVFKFLDGTATVLEDFSVINSLPKSIFLKPLVRQIIRGM
ncbi:MAG: lycopene cyclase family protein [bacterium]